MADLELAEISETAPSALITPPRFFPYAQPPNFRNTLVNPRPKFVSSTKAIRRPHSSVAAAVICGPKLKGLVIFGGPFLPDAHSASPFDPRDLLDEALCGSGFFHDGDLLAEAYASSLGAIRILSNQGESSGSGLGSGSGSGGGAGEGRNGGNQGVGGGGQREGIGNERRGNSGRNHGGANGGGDDDGDDRGGWVGYIGGERGPMGPGPHRWEEIQLFLNAQMIGTLESFDIRDLPARARIFRVVSWAFNSVALVVLSASIGQRRMSPRLASILSWIGSFATLLGFISLIGMAFSASFIP
ncbi:hypothetical protein ACB092_01G423700 [Castanea dentata]